MANTTEQGPGTKALPTYCYSPLPSDDSIRLLDLGHGLAGSPLKGALRVASLSDNPQYVALSYVWGDPTKGHAIALGEKALGITRSLSDALQDLRSLGTDKSRTFTYWIDQICINQDDIQERNKQVRRMSEIYKRSALVMTYIGPGDQESYEGFILAEKLSKFADSHSSGDPFHDAQHSDFGYLTRRGFPPREHRSWHALGRLMNRSWASRAWIVQESLMNIRKTVMICGTFVVDSWNLLSRVAFFSVNGRIPRIPWTDGVSPSILINQIDFRDFIIDDKYPHPKTLYHLLRLCHILKSTDPRDKIYALLGVAPDRERVGIVPDYEQEVVQLYIAVAVRLIEVYGNFDVFSSVFSGRSLDLPSWVPDWSTLPPGSIETLINNPILLQRNLRDACGGRNAEARFSDNLTRLHVKGIVLDRIGIIQETNIDRRVLWVAVNFILANNLDRLETLPMYAGCGESIASWKSLLQQVAARPYVTVGSAGEMDSATTELCNRFMASMPEVVSKDGMSPSSNAKTLLAAFEHTARPRRLFIGEKGYLGLGPEVAKTGDLVVVLPGGKFPYIVREAEKDTEHFQLLGETYVHGVMRGEAFEQVDGDLRTFTLV